MVEWWPPLDAPTVLGWLRDPEFLARVAEGVLSEEDQRLLTKSWADQPAGQSTHSVEDVPLLDELRYALGDVPDARRGRPRARRLPAAATCRS